MESDRPSFRYDLDAEGGYSEVLDARSRPRSPVTARSMLFRRWWRTCPSAGPPLSGPQTADSSMDVGPVAAGPSCGGDGFWLSLSRHRMILLRSRSQ